QEYDNITAIVITPGVDVPRQYQIPELRGPACCNPFPTRGRSADTETTFRSTLGHRRTPNVFMASDLLVHRRGKSRTSSELDLSPYVRFFWIAETFRRRTCSSHCLTQQSSLPSISSTI